MLVGYLKNEILSMQGILRISNKLLNEFTGDILEYNMPMIL